MTNETDGIEGTHVSDEYAPELVYGGEVYYCTNTLKVTTAGVYIYKAFYGSGRSPVVRPWLQTYSNIST